MHVRCDSYCSPTGQDNTNVSLIYKNKWVTLLRNKKQWTAESNHRECEELKVEYISTIKITSLYQTFSGITPYKLL